MEKQSRLSPYSLFLAGLAWLAMSPAFAGFSDFFSVNGIYSRRLSGDIGHENGIGTSATLEFQAMPSLSLGLGLNLINYLGPQTPGKTLLESIEMVSRIQFRANNVWTPYLMFGGGFNARTDFDRWHTWPWQCQLMGGAGTWYFLSRDTALDVGANYRIFNGSGNPLQTMNARLGLSFFFGETIDNPVMTAKAVIDLPGAGDVIAVAQAAAPAEEEIPPPSAEEEAKSPVESATAVVAASAAPPLVVASMSNNNETAIPPLETKNEEPSAEATPEPTVVVQSDPEAAPKESSPDQSPEVLTKGDAFVLQYGEILTLKGDSVWDTAARREVYYDPELYPLIVDANREALERLYVFEIPKKLRFPTNATEEMKQKARRDAWMREYQTLGGRRLIPWAYQRWLKNHDLPNNFQEK